MAARKPPPPPPPAGPSAPRGWTWVVRFGVHCLVPLDDRDGPARARIEKRTTGARGARQWVLVTSKGEVPLGPKATYDVAERHLARLGIAQEPPAAAPLRSPKVERVDAPAKPAEPPPKPAPPKPPTEPRGSVPAGERTKLKRPVVPKAAMKTNPLDTLRASRQEAIQLASVKGVDATRALLERAQRELDQRLRQSVARGAGDTFTAEQLRQSLEQVRYTLQGFGPELGGVVRDFGGSAAEFAAEDTFRYLKESEQRFRGIAQPMQLQQAAMLDRAVKGADSSLLNRLQGDAKAGPGILERYSDAVIQSFEEVLQQRFIQGKPWEDTRNALIAESPFLQGAPGSWAERIVRTEVMGAHNRSGWEVIRGVEEEEGGALKVLVATFDGRTGADSYALHGQIRRANEAFQDWNHMYQSPPNRPNDREVVVIHMQRWPLLPEFRWRTDAEVHARWVELGNKKPLPPRPPMTTVPLDQIGPRPAPSP